MKSLPIAQEQLAALCRRYRVEQLSLFGSMLRTDFHPESDVDLLVTFAPDAEIGFLALSRLRRELEALFNRPVDLVPQEGLKPRIRESVLASAELLYAA